MEKALGNFSLLLEKCLGQNLKLLDIVQNFWPLPENSSYALVSQASYVPERSMCEKEALLPKKHIFGTSAPSKQGRIQVGSIAHPKI